MLLGSIGAYPKVEKPEGKSGTSLLGLSTCIILLWRYKTALYSDLENVSTNLQIR